MWTNGRSDVVARGGRSAWDGGAERPVTWMGQPARQVEGSLEVILRSLPTFTKSPFELFALNPPGAEGLALRRPLLGPVGNPRLDLIFLSPRGAGETAVPVAAVSKGYRLIQHTEAAGALVGALERLGAPARDLAARLLMTERGERMSLRVVLGELGRPGGWGPFPARDGYPLKLEVHCLNSVDGTTAFQANVGWYRQVCGNGLVVSLGENRVFRQVHRREGGGVDLTVAEESLLESVRRERIALSRWERWPVSEGRVAAWADGEVARRWGVTAAARVYHVACFGQDGPVEYRRDGAAAHRRRLLSARLVPGAAVPSRTVYDVCQALSWVADHDPVFDNRMPRLRQIPELAARLMERVAN